MTLVIVSPTQCVTYPWEGCGKDFLVLCSCSLQRRVGSGNHWNSGSARTAPDNMMLFSLVVEPILNGRRVFRAMTLNICDAEPDIKAHTYST